MVQCDLVRLATGRSSVLIRSNHAGESVARKPSPMCTVVFKSMLILRKSSVILLQQIDLQIILRRNLSSFIKFPVMIRSAFSALHRVPLLVLEIFVLLALAVSSASAQHTYSGTDGNNIMEGSRFTGASGETLTVGAAGEGAYHAVVQGLNSGGGNRLPLAEVTVRGSSSLTFSGRDKLIDITQQCAFNFTDQSRLLLGAGTGANDSRGHVFGEGVILNYSSRATSDNKNLPLKFSVIDEDGFVSKLNINSGLIRVGGLDFHGPGIVNLSGGDFAVKVIGKAYKTSGGKINFESSAGSTLTVSNAKSSDYLDEKIRDGLFQVDGITQTDPSAFDINYSVSNGSLTVRLAASKQATIPELSITPLVLGLFALISGVSRRRR